MDPPAGSAAQRERQRIGFRARAVDVTTRLAILRSMEELAEEATVLTVKAREPKQGKVEEIPTPEVWPVASYETDYLPVFTPPASYLRSGFKNESEFVEYDLDDEDEDWLRTYNGTQDRLPADRFEHMLWKLELACADAQAQTLFDMQTLATERSLPPPSYSDKVTLAANTSCLTREGAFEALGRVSKRPAAIAAVYVYWLGKRKRWGKPVLRRLQPPPAGSDQNPFLVFRPREKTNRPQTRRRRENDSPAFNRMRNLRMNLDMSRALLEWLQRRERRKRDILQCDIDTQLLQLKLRHDAPRVQAAPESAPAGEAELRTRAQASDPAASDLAPAQSNGLVVRTMGPPPQDAAKREKKRRRDGRDRRAAGGAELAFVPPPQLSEPQMHFLTPNLRVPGFNLPAAVRGMRGRTRFGRGGRLLFDRVHPITREPFALPDVVLPPRRALPPVPLLIAPAPVAPAPAATKLDGPAAASAEVAPMET